MFADDTSTKPIVAIRGRKLISCSRGQELGQHASWLLIGYTRENSQSEAGQQVDPTFDHYLSSQVSASGGEGYFL